MLFIYIPKVDLLTPLALRFISLDWRRMFGGYCEFAMVRLVFRDNADMQAARAVLAARKDVEIVNERPVK